MPYVTIPKDLSRIKNKLVFNLTKRQLISFSLAGGIGIPFYLFSRSVIGGDVAAFLMIALMLPFMAFGVYEKDGQPLEKILYHMIRARFLLPRIRVYQTDNLYSALERQAKIDKEVMEIVYHKQKRKIERKNKSKKEKLIIGGVDARLGRTEKQRLTLAVKKAKRDGKIPKSAQQTIAYQELYPDGLCKVKDKLYTKTMQFSDINYQLARPEDKTQIFELWCDFFNYMDPSIKIQLSFVNEYVNRMDYEKSIDIPKREDGFDDVRREYSEMLSAQLGKGNNGLIRKKYLTFGIYAEDMKTARLRLERIEADLIGNLKALGVKARTLSGLERLKVLHNAFHPGGQEKLRFAWDSIVKTGLSTKDFISPSSFDFRDSKTFQMGSTLGAVSFVQIIAPELNDRMLSDLLNLDSALTVTFHIRSLNQAEAIKAVKRKLTDIEKGKIEEQKKAVR